MTGKNSNKNKIIITERLVKLETIVEDLSLELKSIKNNHLEKIYLKLDDFQKTITEIQINLLKKAGEKPSWAVALTITILTSITTALITILLTKP